MKLVDQQGEPRQRPHGGTVARGRPAPQPRHSVIGGGGGGGGGGVVGSGYPNNSGPLGTPIGELLSTLFDLLNFFRLFEVLSRSEH